MSKIISQITSQMLSMCRNFSSPRKITAISSMIHPRNYSQYPKVLREPIIPKDEIKTVLESEAYKEIELLPVRAALNYYTSSMFLEPKIMKFTNYVMECGKKAVARRVVTETLTHIKRIQVGKYNRASPESRQHIELDPIKIFITAIANGKPHLRIMRIRHGATWYQVPKPISDKMAEERSMKWYIEAGNDKAKDARFFKTLAKELIDGSENKGRVINKKIELHKLGEANKAYAHFRWG